jgi:3-keto-L-gulonate-6-phosphate decarboxylase
VVVASPVRGVLAKNNSDNLIAQHGASLTVGALYGTPLFPLNSRIPAEQAVAAGRRRARVLSDGQAAEVARLREQGARQAALDQIHEAWFRVHNGIAKSRAARAAASSAQAAVARARGRAKIEISGGVTLERMPELAATGADYVSVGALTHSAPAADISFDVIQI